ncbi:disease resistance protein RPV1-like [Rosa rugosa]|uniref:disease resistance protein RPV1-like n=1 Tax=Rosa rugosa TaxID=74645 RepID=UPI002B40B8A6|nr:disease resistance protein RPV1-like [Rosa rugosa]XP_061991092.1 disease resistance protein RPV1-like [Rosa rugosa]XP_061991093.1 disease resistance protein RPV1-like [Rosa rugosa]XP_061991094.1 disease resistance protein RPV1-like [Rosa rugosa]XP_061991095.1 disease resistance protein RPV1-like [Rosa rugosa]XP_061991096.1 disease resistance protein RPV1-like [Rosa rugosa]XP_061991097.1 disease resistance protein RPV1-like [Rosa rugosa]
MASLNNEAAASSSSSSLPLCSTDHQNHYTYEVFLSFRGEDTRFNFTDHLYTALCQRGIETFRDDKLSRGEDISQELLKAIDESRVSIVVFSQNYASSRWCLDELVKILDCRKSKGQKFRAVFYKVAPSDVRHQTGAFGDAFAKIDQCEYKDSIGKWRKALEEAAVLSGWTFEEGRYETEFINDIVGELSTQVVNPSSEWHVAEHPIGLESCIQDINSLLKAEENIFRMVGIWGTGGIGKTTIAKAVFNSICYKFETSCFLADVRSNSNDLAQLQERLLHDVLRDSNLKVSSVDQGVSFIKERMQNKKVLLILDDVSHSSQLKNLVPSPDCFGPGSRILITTRDKRWLIAHEVNEVYEVKMLDDRHALELFSLHAFKRNEPPSDYLKLAQHVIRYAQGLPLAVIVLGSHLFRRSTEEWEATIGSCKGGPQADIQKVLQLSYDALGRDLKELFLDIACFFKGKRAAHVKPILEACYDHKTIVIGITQLQEQALIRIDKDDQIWMHDLIEEMGKDIVYQESPDEPGKRSRVWSEEDVDYILTNNTGTNKVIGIQVPWQSSTISLNAKSFSKMKNLRYISMRRILFSGDIDYLSNQLRWLEWQACPLQCFPSDFQANKLVELNITSRKIRQPWEGRKNFSRLTCMNLSHCTSLKKLPDLSGIPNLKELNLSGCPFLKELPDLSGIPNLKELNLSGCTSLKKLPDLSGIPNLKELNLSGCESLKELPDLSEIPNLKELNLSGCESLKELPDLSGIPNLKGLNLSGCVSLKELPDFCGIPNLKELELYKCIGLVEVPDSIRFLHKLVTLNIGGCSNLIVFPRKINLKYVETISISYCKLEEFSEIGEEMGFLRKLDLRGTCIKELHPSITRLIRLEKLDLTDSQNLTILPYNIYELHNLKTLYASGCSKLATFPKIPVKMDSLRRLSLKGSDIRELDESIENLIGLEHLDLTDCKNLITLPCSIYGLQSLKELHLNRCSKLVRFPTNTKILNVDGCSLSLPNLQVLVIAGCSLLSDCDFLTTLDCWETLWWLNLSRNNFVSLPACLTKFVKLQMLTLGGCKRLRGIPELPPNVEIRGCELLEERFSTLTNRGAVIEAASPSIEEPTPSSWLSLSSWTSCFSFLSLRNRHQ